MRIAVVSECYYPLVWWWPNHVHNLITKLATNHNCNVDFFCRSLRDEQWNIWKKWYILGGKIHIIRCWLTTQFFNVFGLITYSLDLACKIISYNRRNKYQIIHTHGYIDSFVVRILRIFLNFKQVVTIHWSPNIDKWKHNIKYFIEKFVYFKTKYDAQIAVWKHLLDIQNINTNISVIGNGINIDEFQIDNVKKYPGYKILFVWRLERTKGIDTLIESIYILKNTYKQNFLQFGISVSIVWFGVDEFKLKDMVTNYWLSDIIKFCWKKSWEELAKEYVSSHLFVCPSRSEWFWIIILEAMAAWIPVISTMDSWGPKDIIESWYNWVLIKKDNPQTLADSIWDFLQNKYDTDMFIKNWKKTLIARYTWDVVVNQIFALYKKLLKSH